MRLAILAALSSLSATLGGCATGNLMPNMHYDPEAASISIMKITKLDGWSIDPKNVSGVIEIITQIQAPIGLQLSAMRVTANSIEVCRRPFEVNAPGDYRALISASCSFDTLELDGSGQRRYPDGQYTLRAELLDTLGSPVATATFPEILFKSGN